MLGFPLYWFNPLSLVVTPPQPHFSQQVLFTLEIKRSERKFLVDGYGRGFCTEPVCQGGVVLHVYVTEDVSVTILDTSRKE